MERYYIVTEKSSLHKEWFSYIENRHMINELVKTFTAENEIESTEYYVSQDEFHIVPTKIDETRFATFLCQPLSNGLQKFKSSSKISKAWVKALKDAGLTVERKPMVILYLRGIGGKYKSRLFDQDGILYCSIDPVADQQPPDGFIEMKASEFFKVIEDSEMQSA